MRRRNTAITALGIGLSLGFGGCGPSTLASQSLQDARVVDGFRILGKIDDDSMADAAGVIVLEFGRGGFGLGMTVGHGVAVRRLEGRWSPPVPLDLVSGSIGAQIGGEGGRIMLICQTTESFERLIFDGASFLAEASGTAGNATGGAGRPVDQTEVRVLTDVGGLYGGAVIGGYSLKVDSRTLKRAYGEDAGPRQVLDDVGVGIPAGTETLWNALDG